MNTFSLTGTYTDLYQLTMAQVYFLKGTAGQDAVFDYFFRKLPFGGGYAVFAGLNDLLETLEDLHFTGDDLDYLRSIGLDKEFVDHLRTFRFRGDIHAVREGEVVFPDCPILRVEGTILEAQLIETLLLNLLNFQTLVATRAARMRQVAGTSILSDFGLRRAQGLGGYHASRAAIVGGFDATSNVKAARDFGISPAGTMAHSFIQSYDSELGAFRDFAEKRPHNCVLLVDTYDTLRSGVPNAIKVAREMEANAQKLQGIRLDSGDLAYLAKESRRMLDGEGLDYVRITVSNQLNEYVIKSLKEQQAPIDVFGVGTSLVTCPPDAALDGVYKLSFANGRPRIKLSENVSKITLPHKKQVFRLLDQESRLKGADIITLEGEKDFDVMYHAIDPEKSMQVRHLQREALLEPVMVGGKRCAPLPTLKEISSYSAGRLERLPQEYKRFENPHVYKVGISRGLKDLRNELKNQNKK